MTAAAVATAMQRQWMEMRIAGVRRGYYVVVLYVSSPLDLPLISGQRANCCCLPSLIYTVVVNESERGTHHQLIIVLCVSLSLSLLIINPFDRPQSINTAPTCHYTNTHYTIYLYC